MFSFLSAPTGDILHNRVKLAVQTIKEQKEIVLDGMRTYNVNRDQLRQMVLEWIDEEKAFLKEQSSVESTREDENRKLKVDYTTALLDMERLRV